MRIGFTGPYCTANFGDWAMLINNIYDFGDNEYFVFTYSNTFPHSAIDYYKEYRPIKLIEVLLNDRDTKLQDATPLDCLQTIQNKEQLKSIVENLDVLVVSGGGWLNDKWCKRIKHFYRVMAPILLAKQKNVPIRFMAQGIGPIVETKEMMRAFFNYLGNDVVVSVRDQYCSESFLNDFFHRGLVKFIPDDLAIMNRKLFCDGRGNKLSGKLISEPYFILITNTEMDFLQEKKEGFSYFCKRMKDLYGLNVLLLSFDLVFHGDEQASFLNAHISSSDSILIGNKKFIPIEDVISYIQNAEFLITERYHASVIALQTRTPFFVKLESNNSFYAYNKAHGVLDCFLKDIDYDERYFFESQWDELFVFVINHYSEIVEKQKAIFISSKYTNNYQKMGKIRKTYINEYILKDKDINEESISR